jgi:hypothetical protein
VSGTVGEIIAAILALCVSAITAAWILGTYSGRIGERLKAIEERLGRIESIFTLTPRK